MTIALSAVRARFKCLLGVLFALVVADGVITRFLVDNGLARESNPFLQGLVSGDQFLPTKVVGALLSLALLWRLHRRRPRVAAGSSLGFVVLYTGIVYWNLATFLVALPQYQF